MKITKKSGFEKAPLLADGSYQARIYSIVHIGHVKRSWKGQESIKDVIRFSFELPTEMYEFNPEKGEQPYSLSREETASIDPRSGLFKMAAACGINLKEEEEFDVKDLLGKTLMITVDSYETENGSFNGIQAYSPIPKGLPVADAVNETVFYDCEDPDEDVFDTLPEFLQKKITDAKALRDSVIDF
jgi:hypothetical protein